MIIFLPWSSSGNLNSRYAFSCLLLPLLICWYLWLARNEHRFEGTAASPYSIIQKVKQSWYEISTQFKPRTEDNLAKKRMLANARIHHEGRVQVEARIIYWVKPPPGMLKLNVDGASKGNPGRSGGGGGISCRVQGNVINLHSTPSLVADPACFLAELRALLTGP